MLPVIEDVETCAIFLDLDGTLAPIAERPDAARVDKSTVRLLELLSRRVDHALAIVSGRSISVVDTLLSPLILPVAGVHGLQRRNAAGTLFERDAPSVASVARAIERSVDAESGLVVERKPGAVALNYRMRPELERLCADLMLSLSRAEGLRLMRSKMAFELVAEGDDKGAVIEKFLSEEPFCARRPIFAGDDVTDEPGFAAVNARGGVSIKIGEEPSLAQHRVKDLSQLLDWLAALAGASTGAPTA